MRITNELLLEKINNIKDDTEEIKEDFKSDSKEQWKYINKNAQSISSIKGASGVIAFFVSVATAFIATYFGKQS